jgi:hypothetical protein
VTTPNAEEVGILYRFVLSARSLLDKRAHACGAGNSGDGLLGPQGVLAANCCATVGFRCIGVAAFAARDGSRGISDRYSSSTQPSDHSTRVP